MIQATSVFINMSSAAFSSNRSHRARTTPTFIETWTVWDPRERFAMDSRFRMRVYDVLLNFLVFTPLIILHHQACNGMLDFMFLRRFPTIGAWLLLVVGVGLEFLPCFFYKYLLRMIPRDQEIYPILASHAFIYLLTFANISHIRAVGDLYGMYIGEDWGSTIKAMTTGLATLVGLKAAKNLLAPPLTLTIDSHQHEEVFDTTTLFGTEGDLSPGSALDSFATVGIVHSFIHLYWSGWWSFLDVWLFPNSPALSSLSCIIFGYMGCLVAILFHSIAKDVSRNLQNEDNDVTRLIFEDVYHVFAGTSCITTWRGFWYGFYVLGDNFPILYKGKDVTSVAAHVISFALLALANVSMSLCGKGVDIDGYVKDGEGVLCSVDYFCEYFKDELDEEEQTKQKQQDLKQGLRPVAMVAGSQKVINGSPSPSSTAQPRPRVMKKKVDDDVLVRKPPRPEPRNQTTRKDATNNNNKPPIRRKKEL